MPSRRRYPDPVKRPGIYVECSICATMDELWRLTQTPDIHQRWDLRFTTIDYLPSRAGEPQRFVYTTRIGFGLDIRGTGETTGERLTDGSRTSALSFASPEALSLIEEGSGYWRYLQHGPDRLRFFTWYDYRVRYGLAGRIADLVFRPLIGWATAWSFDRLRLWLEDGLPPETVLRSTAIYTLCRAGVCVIWLWHGLVPKILFHNPDELRMLVETGLSPAMVNIAGWAEVAIALAGLLTWRWRAYLLLSALAMLVALLTVALHSREYLTAAFNPVTLNLGVVLLCTAAWLAYPSAAFAARCRRAPHEEIV